MIWQIANGIEEVIWIEETCLGHPRAGERDKYALETVKNRRQRVTVRAPEAWNKLPGSVVEAS